MKVDTYDANVCFSIDVFLGEHWLYPMYSMPLLHTNILSHSESGSEIKIHE